MYILDSQKFYERLKERGYATLGALAKALKIHRNTLHYYLAGRGVFPKKLGKALEALDLKPAEILISKKPSRFSSLEPVAEITDRLQTEFPGITFILFGSRAKGTACRYADWDLGVYSRRGISHEIFRKMKRRLEEMAEDSPFIIDLTNLDKADSAFLRNISGSWFFLGGKLEDWLDLNKKAAPWKN